MPRVCTVCTHPDIDAINREIVAGELSARLIAANRGISSDSVTRHRLHLRLTLPQARAVSAVQAAEVAAEAASALNVTDELRRCFARVNLLFDACDRWLRDPDDPSRYELGPRAEDVRVTYDAIGADGKGQRRKERLSVLLDRLEGSGSAVVAVEYKHADPRDLILRAAAQLQSQTELLAKLVGDLEVVPTVNLVISPEWSTVRTAMFDALGPHPDARVAVAERLLMVEASNGHARG